MFGSVSQEEIIMTQISMGTDLPAKRREAVGPARNGAQVGVAGLLSAGAAWAVSAMAAHYGVPAQLAVPVAGGASAATAGFLGVIGSVARDQIHTRPDMNPFGQIFWRALSLVG